MKGKGGFGWQTSLADLALILFMLSAAALNNRRAETPAEGPSERSEALAVYHATEDAPRLDTWIAQQSADPRQQLTITVRYQDGGTTQTAQQALEQAVQLLSKAGQHGRSARIVVEPGIGPAKIGLAFDVPSTLTPTQIPTPPS